MSSSPFPIITIAGHPWINSRPSAPRLDKGGWLLPRLQQFGLSDNILSSAYDLWELTCTIKQYMQSPKNNLALPYLMDMRSTIQHRLLALPTFTNSLEETHSKSYINEVYRLSMLLYSIAVTYPIPVQKHVRQKLVVDLQIALRRSRSLACWRQLPEGIFWPLYFGAIAANYIPERQWFIEQICTFKVTLSLHSWADVREIMDSFLWLDSACESGGKIVWAEICNDGQWPMCI